MHLERTIPTLTVTSLPDTATPSAEKKKATREARAQWMAEKAAKEKKQPGEKADAEAAEADIGPQQGEQDEEDNAALPQREQGAEVSPYWPIRYDHVHAFELATECTAQDFTGDWDIYASVNLASLNLGRPGWIHDVGVHVLKITANSKKRQPKLQLQPKLPMSIAIDCKSTGIKGEIAIPNQGHAMARDISVALHKNPTGDINQALATIYVHGAAYHFMDCNVITANVPELGIMAGDIVFRTDDTIRMDWEGQKLFFARKNSLFDRTVIGYQPDSLCT